MDNIPLSKDARKLAFIGAGVLALGTFMPIVSVPIMGNLNLFNGGQGDGVLLVALAAVGAVLAYLNQTKHVLWTGIAAAAFLLWGLIRFMNMKSELRAELGGDMANNPFRGLAEAAMDSVQLQWGWVPLALGAGLLIYAGWVARNDGSAAAEDKETSD